MKPINEYLLSKNSIKTNHVVSAKVADHENDIVVLNDEKTYAKFINWFENALTEYGDLTADEQKSCRIHLYYDGLVALELNNAENWHDADFKINGITYKDAYDKIIKFIIETIKTK